MKAAIVIPCDNVASNYEVTLAAAQEIARDFSEALVDQIEIVRGTDGNVMKFVVECKDRRHGEALTQVFRAVLRRHGLLSKF